jgi:hypothetical protein
MGTKDIDVALVLEGITVSGVPAVLEVSMRGSREACVCLVRVDDQDEVAARSVARVEFDDFLTVADLGAALVYAANARDLVCDVNVELPSGRYIYHAPVALIVWVFNCHFEILKRGSSRYADKVLIRVFLPEANGKYSERTILIADSLAEQAGKDFCECARMYG